VECVFCGTSISKGNASSEHVFPLWLQSRLGIKKTPYLSGVTDIVSGEVDQREHTLNTVVVKRVCSDCNNGWMSRLEQEMKLLIEPVFQGHVELSTLSKEHQLSLVRWAHKTTLAAFATGNCRTKTIPKEHFREAAMCNPIPAGLHVVGAHLGGGTNRSGIYLGSMLMTISSSDGRTFTNRELSESYSSIIQLGNTVLATVFCSAPVHYLWLSSRYHWPMWRSISEYVWYESSGPNVEHDEEVAFWEQFMNDLMISSDRPDPTNMRLPNGELIKVIPSPPNRDPNVLPPPVNTNMK